MDVYRKVTKPTTVAPPVQNPAADPGGSTAGIAPLITMLAVLAIILIFCFCGAPAVRQFCRRRICCCCPLPPQDDSPGTPVDNTSTTPTIILLPFGRMLVVDRSVFAQFQTDDAGLDFMELSANLIRAHHLQYGSTPSILDSETTSKGLSPSSLGFSPPAYEDICGEKPNDLPPSYSELSLLFRQQTGPYESANNRLASGPHLCVQNSSSNVNSNKRNFDSVLLGNENCVHIKTSPGTSSNVHIENERVANRRMHLASEENFAELDETQTRNVARGISDSNVHISNSGLKPNVFSKQYSF